GGLSPETFIAVVPAAARYAPPPLLPPFPLPIPLQILRAGPRQAAFRSFFFAPHAATDSVGGTAKNSDEILWLRQAVARLDAIEREVLLLREFEQLSYVEIADVLKLPLNTVRSRLFRARFALRELLEPSPATNSVPLGELS